MALQLLYAPQGRKALGISHCLKLLLYVGDLSDAGFHEDVF
jgi:hypothetical protein